MKNKIITVIFIGYIFAIFILNIVIKDIDISYSERRYLTKLSKITITNILNGTIFDNFEDYANDQFVFRDNFRKLKVYTIFKVFNEKDYNNLYIDDKYIYKIEYPLNINSINNFVNKINFLYEKYLNGMNVFYSIIPDKNYYVDNNYLKIDYNKLFHTVNYNINKNISYIDITDCLDISDFYYTDAHWRQERLADVVDKISANMNFNITNNYQISSYKPFYGSYYGQILINSSIDEIKYLTNNYIEKATVYDYSSDLVKVYETEMLGSVDSYDVFLGGATPLIEIYNNGASTNKELVIFRDSFASSLAPLLLDGYKKITLIDLRYLDSDLLNEYISFSNQDILFLYNTTIINNSNVLKINVN